MGWKYTAQSNGIGAIKENKNDRGPNTDEQKMREKKEYYEINKYIANINIYPLKRT